MANKEKIDYLLLDIRELEKLVAGMRDAEIYPASFFSETFQLTHKLLKELHFLEEHQIDALRKQMEEHQRLIASIPIRPVFPEPEIPELVTLPQPETIEEKLIEPPTITQEPVREPETVVVEVPLVKEEPVVVESPAVFKEPASIPQPEVSYKTIHPEKTGISLNEILEKQNLSDFRKAFSLNDRFRFRRELFGGNEEKMNKAITDLNDIRSYEESVSYLNNVLCWNVEDASVADFLKLLEKRFL